MEAIRIGDKHYNVETLTEQARTYLRDIQKVDSELGRLTLQTSIANLAKGVLIEKLLVETSNLEEIEVVDEPEQSTD